MSVVYNQKRLSPSISSGGMQTTFRSCSVRLRNDTIGRSLTRAVAAILVRIISIFFKIIWWILRLPFSVLHNTQMVFVGMAAPGYCTVLLHNNFQNLFHFVFTLGTVQSCVHPVLQLHTNSDAISLVGVTIAWQGRDREKPPTILHRIRSMFHTP